MKKIRFLTRLVAVLAVLALVACAGTDSSRSTGTYIDDKTISAKVKTELAGDSLTQALQVEIETYNGVVQLSGFVDKKETIKRAEEITRGVPGVKEVKNNLVLREK